MAQTCEESYVPQLEAIDQQPLAPPRHTGCGEVFSRLCQERVLVTGGAGFIGGHVVSQLLAFTPTVGVLDNFSVGTWSNLAASADRGLADADVIDADIRDRATVVAALSRWAPTVIVHLAAQSKVAASMRDPAVDAEVNVLGTLNVLAAARSAGVRHIVAASSGGTVYGQAGAAGHQVNEGTRKLPVSPYGIAKAAADDYLTLFQNEYGLSSTSLAIGNAYGPSVDGGPGEGVVAAFVTSLLAGHPATIHGDGEQTRDFVHVRDVADAFVGACAYRPAGRINIGSGTATSLSDLLCQVAGLLGASPAADRIASEPGEVRHIRLDIRQAARQLGWRPRIPLLTGIGHVITAARTARVAI